MKNVLTKLLKIQQELKVPKNQKNSFGGYYFRNCEDIMEASKPICAKYDCLLICSDEIIAIGNHQPVMYEENYYDKELKKENAKHGIGGAQRYYVKATVTLYDIESGESISTTASAREEETKKGMDASQITGASSSYARKYALNGLLQLDDNKDADTNEFKKQQSGKEVAKKETTKKVVKNEDGKEMVTAEQVKRIHTYLTKIEKAKVQVFKNFTNETAKENLYKKFKVKSSKELTKTNADEMIEVLKKKVDGLNENNQ